MSEQRVALVTGGAKRVGAAIVQRLVASGFFVFYTYRSSGRESAKLLAAHSGQVQPIEVDLANPQTAIDAIKTALAERGERLDLLVNSASAYIPESKLDATGRQMLMTVNHETPVQLIRALADRLQRSNGCVVNMLDLMAERPWPAYATYCASKAALLNATIALARELAPAVRVNGISPGVVDWPEDYPLEEREKYLLKVPLRRPGTPQDVASLVHFLATEGTYITGQNIRLDGGRSIG